MIGTAERPLRVAIVGSGPSGFYAAGALLNHKAVVAEVDLFDRLPTPYGLVRGGVAPDHQKIKNVVRVYDRTAARPGFRYFGNVRVGWDLPVDALRALYDQVVFAVGCEGARSLGIPGEDLPGSWSATEFVGWYNAHPDYVDRRFDLSHRAAVVVGVGNVAMDVTRVLVKDPDLLYPTDIAEHALEALRAKGVTDVYVLGRRGPAQAAFSPAEIKEIGDLDNVDLVLPERSHVLDPVSAEDWGEADKRTVQNVEYLQARAAAGTRGRPMRVHLLLCTSPVEVLGSGDRMVAVRCEINELVRGEDGRIRPRGTGETFEIEAGLMLRSVGYKGRPIPGLPFDARRGILPNDAGRVIGDDGAPLPGVYVVGWAKRGPSGLIGTNRADSVATVQQMLADLPGLDDRSAPAEARAEAIARHCPQHTTWADWEVLNAAEVAAGEASGRVRVKFPTVEAMLEALGR